MDFIRVVVQCQRTVKQERNTGVKGICKTELTVIDCGIY